MSEVTMWLTTKDMFTCGAIPQQKESSATSLAVGKGHVPVDHRTTRTTSGAVASKTRP